MSLLLTGAGTPGALNPSSISGLKLWLKADSLSLNDGDAVTSWTDSSGSGNSVTQATGANQPIYKTSIINGKPVVRFDGTNDDLRTAISPTVPSQAPFTMIAVAKPSSSGGLTKRIVGWTTNGWGAGQSGNTSMFVTTFGVKDYSTGTDDFNPIAQFRVVTYNFTSAFSVLFWLDGTSKGTVTGTTNATAGGANTFSIGSRASEYWASDIAEILIYDSTLSTTDRQAVQSYLGSRYGITVS